MQLKQMEVTGSFLEKMTELSAKRAASALGQRSGQVRRRKRDAKFARSAEQLECRLYRNPSITNPTAQEIVTHAAHEALDAQPLEVHKEPESETA